jgi:hypothetical protein
MTTPLLTYSNPGFHPEWCFLDFATADNATPKWYSVSSGDGNNGVSRMYPDYYVRTADPFHLAVSRIREHSNVR